MGETTAGCMQEDNSVFIISGIRNPQGVVDRALTDTIGSSPRNAERNVRGRLLC